MDSVLIVDDEDALGAVLVEVFASSGFEATHALSAEEGIAAFREKPRDLLVVDKNLPGMSGLDFIRAIREISGAPAIVLITGYSSPESAEQALNLDVDAYLEKPFDSLFGMVDLGKRLIARRREPRAAPREPETALLVAVAGPDAGTLSLLLGPGVAFETFPTAEALRARPDGPTSPDLIVLQTDHVADLPAVVRAASKRAPGATWVVLYDQPLPLPLLQDLIELGVKALFDHDAYRRTVGDLLERIRHRKKQR